jgi:hypothetical protein
MVPVDEVAAHPRFALAVSIARAQRKHRVDVLQREFRELAREDQLGVGRVLAVLSRLWVEG